MDNINFVFIAGIRVVIIAINIKAFKGLDYLVEDIINVDYY